MSVSPSLPERRSIQALMLMIPLLLAGCGDTSQSPEDPRILGVPPQVAYLGVDYSYNFGATGGDNLLNYSLVNNPSWLALDATTNKARKGIVLRGVPGVTGGRAGEDDLGNYDRIRITSNDGNLLGDTAFTIEVRHNALEIDDTTLTEGQANEPTVNKDSDEMCEIPDMDVAPEIPVEHENLVVDDGENYTRQTNQYTTHRSLIRVDLAQPSVEPVSVRFRISDDQDRTDEFCDDEDGPCEYAGSNRGRAIFGEDLFLNGNASRYQGGGFPEPPEYIEYIEENETEATGLLNFEAGQTTCFIPVWVHDDNLAEQSEYFNVELERVTEGIASVSEDGAVASQRVTIEDETPTVSLSDSTLVLSDNRPQTVTAELSRPNDTGRKLYALLEVLDEEGDAVEDINGCAPGGCAEGGSDSELPLVLTFEEGEEEVTFDLRADGVGSGKALEEEVVRELRFRRAYQYGRDSGAGTTDTSSTAYINEWTTDVANTELEDEFRIESLVAGERGEVYVAGTEDGEVGLQSINRLGDATMGETDVVVLGELGGDADWPEPGDGRVELTFAGQNTGTSNAPEITRYLGIGYAGAGAEGFNGLFRSRITTEDDGSPSREPEESSGDDELWTLSPGTVDGVPWNQEAVAVTAGGTLYAAALGDGSDPIRMRRIDTADDDSADPVWIRDLDAGDSSVAGLFTGSISGAQLVGDNRGQLDSDTAVGGRDFFLLGRDDDGSVNERVQFGVEDDDTVRLAASSGDRFWLAGESQQLYESNDFGGLERADDASEAPFLIAVDRTGSVEGVLHPAELEDDGDISTIQALSVSGNTAVLAGDTSGDSAYLMAVRFTNPDDEDADAFERLWRVDVDDAEGVIDMDYFRSRKLFVVLDQGDQQVIRLYDRHGNRLTSD